MADCSAYESPRNRILAALLPLAFALFRLQDLVYALIGKTNWGLATSPPSVPESEAVPYAPEHGYIRGYHGYRLFYRGWPVALQRAKAVLVAVDGMGSYSKQFHPIGESLAPRSIAFYGFDLQGQGLSEGPRSDWSLLPQIVDGVFEFLDYLEQKYPGKPIYVLGESVGAGLVMKLAVRRSLPANLAGLVLASPEIDPTHLTAQGGVRSVTVILKQIPYFLFASKIPSVDIAGRQRLVARGPAVYYRSLHDPLRNNRVTVRSIVATFSLIVETYRLAEQIRLPTLILEATCDEVDNPEAAPSLLRCLATGDKALEYFPGAAHGLFYDPDTPQVVRVIGDWIDRHVLYWQQPTQHCHPSPEVTSDASQGN